MTHMGRQHEDFALFDGNVVNDVVLTDFQNHVAGKLVKEFLHRIIVEIHPLIGAADNLHDPAGFLDHQLVADRKFKILAIVVDPLFKIKRPKIRENTHIRAPLNINRRTHSRNYRRYNYFFGN